MGNASFGNRQNRSQKKGSYKNSHYRQYTMLSAMAVYV